jgi:hypothetical protein
VPGKRAAAESMAVEVFGVSVEVTGEAAHLAAVRDFLPPNARPVAGAPASGGFALVSSGGDGLWELVCDGQSVAGRMDTAVALGVLDARLRMHIALNAPDHIFVHAGVVGIDGRAIVLPGPSFAGKTTLVSALVRAGAGYWSDEYAALDADGLVHPYAKPLSVRDDGWRGEDQHVESLGGRAGDRPLPVGLVVVTHYRPGAIWSPRRCSAGEGALKLLEHTVPARSRPDQALAAVRSAASGATVLVGDRGDAGETAAALIAVLAR